jgi:hypothetical protein
MRCAATKVHFTRAPADSRQCGRLYEMIVHGLRSRNGPEIVALLKRYGYGHHLRNSTARIPRFAERMRPRSVPIREGDAHGQGSID